MTSTNCLMTLYKWKGIKLLSMLKKYLLLTCFFISALAFGQDYPPKPNTLVNDYTNTLSASEKQQLEQKVVAFDDSTSTQISVVMLRSLGGYDIDDYGVELGRRWGIGQKEKNNGILILVALEDRKLAIKTGYGVEGALPDAAAYSIRQNEINPYFKKGQYYEGLNAGIDAIIKYTKGEYKAEKKTKKGRSAAPIGFFVIVIIIIIVIISKNSGGSGGGGRIIGRRGSASPLWWFLAGDMMGRSSGGGGWGGFSGGGGGSGGGGFGGFGGGSFGGGGSSGSW